MTAGITWYLYVKMPKRIFIGTSLSEKSTSKPKKPKLDQIDDHEIQAQDQVKTFWPDIKSHLSVLKANPQSIKKETPLPLARIKKIMKLDENVNMIAGEVLPLMAKAAEFFILNLGKRAWISASQNKRRTMQKADISSAVAKYDVFDFLIDIVPRPLGEAGQEAESESGQVAGQNSAVAEEDSPGPSGQISGPSGSDTPEMDEKS